MRNAVLIFLMMLVFVRVCETIAAVLSQESGGFAPKTQYNCFHEQQFKQLVERLFAD